MSGEHTTVTGRRPAVGWTLAAITVASWALAAGSAVSLLDWALRQKLLGFDLRFSWVAVRDVAHGVSPYTVRGFKYPPSHLLLLFPLSATGFAPLAHAAAVVVTLAMVATVAIAASLVDRRWWGLTAALGTVLLLHSQPASDEAWLENVSVLVAVAFAAALLLASRERWEWAAVAIGLSLSIKPIVVPALLLFVLVRRWRALALAVALPTALNLVGFLVIPGRSMALGAMLHVFHETSPSYASENSAIVTVGEVLHVPHAAILALRFAAGGVALATAWLAWRWSMSAGSRVVLTSGALMLGLYLAGTLTEDHFMLTLVPLAVAMTAHRSPLRWPTAWIGFLLMFSRVTFPASSAGFAGREAWSVDRCFGMALVLLTLAGGLWLERRRGTCQAAGTAAGGGRTEGDAREVLVGAALP